MGSQKNNIVGGDQAGRDIIKETHVHPPGTHRPSYMTRLMERFDHERENDIRFHQMLEKLQEYCTSVDDSTEVMGLDNKLAAGNLIGFIEFAQQTKEAFSKKLLKLQLYESAQQILECVLAEVYTRYYNLIYPMILDNAQERAIHEAIHEKIVVAVREMLEENLLGLVADEINGALYFLTGNCHVKWV